MPNLDAFGGYYNLDGSEVLLGMRYPNGNSPATNPNLPSPPNGGVPFNFSTQQLISAANTQSAPVSVIAAGTGQTTATPITTGLTIVTSTPAGSGVILVSPAVTQVVVNQGTNPLMVYPSIGGEIQTYGINEPVELVANGGTATFAPLGINGWNVR